VEISLQLHRSQLLAFWPHVWVYSSGFGGFGLEYSTSISLGIEIMGTTRLIISVSANCYTKWTDMGGRISGEVDHKKCY
jgi:hypothetical protein